MDQLLLDLIVKQVMKHFYKVLGISSLGPFSFVAVYAVEKIVGVALTETLLAAALNKIDNEVDEEYQDVVKAREKLKEEDTDENEQALIDAYRKLLSF